MINPILESFLQKHRVLCLSTSGSDGPHSTPLRYAFQAKPLSFFCISQSDSRHMQEIIREAKVAASIAGAIHQGEDLEGVQLWGKAFLREAHDPQINPYYRQFPETRTHVLLKNKTVFLEIQVERLRWIQTFLGLPQRKEWSIEGERWTRVN